MQNVWILKVIKMMTNSGLCNRNENILLLTAVNHWQVINYFFIYSHFNFQGAVDRNKNQ